VFVAWDIENAPLPPGAVVSHVMTTLRNKLKGVLHLDEGMVVDTMAFYNAHPKDPRYALTGTVVGSLRVSNVIVVDVGNKKGAADHALKDAVGRKLRERADGLPLEAIVVVSGDGDFASTLRDIQEVGCTAVLVAGPRPKREMVDEARIVLHWNDVLSVLTASGASPVVPERSACAFFLRGECKFGDMCHNLHETAYPSPAAAALLPAAASSPSAAAAPPSAAVASPAAAPSPADVRSPTAVASPAAAAGASPVVPERSVCAYFSRGKCKFGDTCRYLHESLPATAASPAAAPPGATQPPAAMRPLPAAGAAAGSACCSRATYCRAVTCRRGTAAATAPSPGGVAAGGGTVEPAAAPPPGAASPSGLHHVIAQAVHWVQSFFTQNQSPN